MEKEKISIDNENDLPKEESNSVEFEIKSSENTFNLEGKGIVSRSHHRSGHRSHHHHHHHHHSHSSSKEKEKNKFKRFKRWVNKLMANKPLRIVSNVLIVLIVLSLIVSVWVNRNHILGRYGNDDSSNVIYSNNLSVSVPYYWEEMIKTKSEKVKSLQIAGGKDSVSFVWASDPHIPDETSAKTTDLGKLMASIMEECNIPFSLITGDIGTRESQPKKEDYLRMQAMIPEHLAPLWGSEKLLVALGNHDGCYGDARGSYKMQYSPEEMWQFYFANQALDSRRVFSEDGSYFYVDNVAQKTRFIILNSQYGGKYSTDANGWATNDRFSESCYGQEQLNWLANVALNMPEGYGAVIASHVPPRILESNQTSPYTKDSAQLRGIIDAYNNKTTFQGTHTSKTVPWSNSVVNVDFTGAKGEVIAMFVGHIHQDTVDTKTMSCPIITIIPAGEEIEGDEKADRKFGTDKETNFDVVTINRKTRTINLTRVGWGADRVINY